MLKQTVHVVTIVLNFRLIPLWIFNLILYRRTYAEMRLASLSMFVVNKNTHFFSTPCTFVLKRIFCTKWYACVSVICIKIMYN